MVSLLKLIILPINKTYEQDERKNIIFHEETAATKPSVCINSTEALE